MNNAVLYKKDSIELKDIDEILKIEEIELTNKVTTLKRLRENVHFLKFYSSEILPELHSIQKKLKDEKDPIEIYRLQGKIASLEKFSLEKIDSLIKNYKNKISRLWQNKKN